MPAKTYLFYHLIVTTKYRKPLLNNAHVMRSIAHSARQQTVLHGGELLDLNHGPDLAHVHILIALPPTATLADYTRDFKSESARLSNKVLGRRAAPFWGRRYFAKTVGQGSLETARRYVAEQWQK